MLLIRLHSLNLDHKACELEEMVLVEEFFLLDPNACVVLIFLKLHENLVDESVIAVV